MTVRTGTFLPILAGAVVVASSVHALAADCPSIADPMKRLACYDKAAGLAKAATPSAKTSATPPVASATFTAAPMRMPTKASAPVESGPRFWIEAEGGIYGFSKNQPLIASTAPPASTGPIFVPTAPGFIGVVTISSVTNPLAVGAPADIGGGGSYRMGYWLDADRTMAIEGSVFYVQGTSSFALGQSPTTVVTNNFINTTPDVFVGTSTDRTTNTVTGGGVSDQLYGADVNFRMKAPPVGSMSNFDIMFGARYVSLDERMTAAINSSFSRVYSPSLGLPGTPNYNNFVDGNGSFGIRNSFIGPQVGFNAEQHWGRYWVASENKLAVGAMIEDVSVSGSSVTSTTPTTTLLLAGVPIAVNGGAPVSGAGGAPAFGLFAQTNRSRTEFAVVPSGNIKLGYDINESVSLTLAYNYLYMSSVGRVGDQVSSPSGVAQSSFFAQGVTFGAKAKF